MPSDNITAWYYLHENGELICKPNRSGIVADIRESTFARALWPVDPCDRAGAWTLLVEGLAAGAKPDRVRELADKWKCSDADAQVYGDRVGVLFMRDGNQWCAVRLADFVNIQESACGFGPTCLEAMAELAKALGYQPSKMWGASFVDLLKVTPPS